MALILEVLEGRSGVRTRIRLETLPLRIGRGLDNDLILDDPYVDARHAQITHGVSGAVIIEDLGSTNGIVVGRGPERVPSVAVVPGSEVRIGRTVLRFRDSAEVVPAALVDNARESRTTPPWTAKPSAQVALSLAAVAAIAVYFWLETYEPTAASETFMIVLAFAAMGSVWSGIWAIAGRIIVQRFRFMAHFALFSSVLLVLFVWTVITEWAAFLFPDNAVADALGFALTLVLVAAIVAGHLALASSLSARRRWTIGAAVSTVVAVLLGLGALTMEETFTDVPEFASTVKAIGAGWVPTHTVAEFEQATAELQKEVDAMLEK
jgi:pSer/pThr/pTyr-binding forkhead associated (FHA) protein